VIRPKLCFAALAVVRDGETNTISAFNIFEGISSVGFPFLLQNAAFFVLWDRDPTDPGRIGATFTVGVDGHPALGTQEIALDFQEVLIHRSIIRLNGLVVPTPGSLRFRIAPETGTAAEFAFDVSAAPPQLQVPGHVQVPPLRH